MPWTEEEREQWLQRAAKKLREVEAEADRLAAPRFGMQWSRWQGEEQAAEEQSKKYGRRRRLAWEVRDALD